MLKVLQVAHNHMRQERFAVLPLRRSSQQIYLKYARSSKLTPSANEPTRHPRCCRGGAKKFTPTNFTHAPSRSASTRRAPASGNRISQGRPRACRLFFRFRALCGDRCALWLAATLTCGHSTAATAADATTGAACRRGARSAAAPPRRMRALALEVSCVLLPAHAPPLTRVVE